MPEVIADYNFKLPISIGFSDIDAYGHVSDTIYLTYFEIAWFNYWKEIAQWNYQKAGIILGRSEVNYLKPITLDDEITCHARVSRIGNSSFDMLYLISCKMPEGGEICTTGKSVCISYDYEENRSVPIPKAERDKMISYDDPRLITNTN